MFELDVVIPVYNEGRNIAPVLESLSRHVKTPFRVFICYDFDGDDTLDAVTGYPGDNMQIVLVKNPGRGPHSAIRAGLEQTSAPAVLTHMADDDYTPPVIDALVAKSREGYEIVTGSRFMPGGRMVGCPWLKWFLTWAASFTLYHLARFPVHDATHGVRVFSRRVLDTIEIESSKGFTFSFEMMVKAVRLGWSVYEVPVEWRERTTGPSRFRLWRWMWPYLRWYGFAYATTWLGRGPETVRLRPGARLERAGGGPGGTVRGEDRSDVADAPVVE